MNVKQDNDYKVKQVENEVVATKQVACDWLKGQSQEQYRTYIYAAFERAQYQYKIRESKNPDQKDQLRSKVKDLSEVLDREYVKKLNIEYQTCDPEVPDLSEGRKKLIKISRNCTKKSLERFFQIDEESDQFVYYANTTSTVPRKTVSLQETRVEIENIGVMDENAVKKWGDLDCKYRVGIKLKTRKFLPVYYYTDSLHEAKCTKMSIESHINMNDQVPDSIKEISGIFNTRRFHQLFQRMLLLKIKRIKFQNMCQKIQMIQFNFIVDRREQLKLWTQQIRKEEVKEQIVEVPKVPKIWSTFKCGEVRIMDQQVLKAFSRMQRGLDYLVKAIRERKRSRNATIQDMIQQKIRQKAFNCTLLQYSVHDSILQNMHKLGDIPYVINDVVGQQIRVEGENLVIMDKKNHEYLIPVGEICFMASDFGFKEQQKNIGEQAWRLHLRGRKINVNVESIGDNILPQQLGLERQKHSRLNMKTIFRVGLKSLFIPRSTKEVLEGTLVNEFDVVMYRLRFDVGEFHCYTTTVDIGNQTQFELKDDLILDINEVKHIKITLIAIKGRQRPFKQQVNEFVNEKEVGSVSIKLRDFEDQIVSNEILHNLAFNGAFYNPKDNKIATSRDYIVLTSALIVDQVNGATSTQEMEGSQLLIGKYILYKKKFVGKVLKLNRDKTCMIKLLDTQPNVQQFKNLTIDKVQLQQDISLIEKYGVSLLNIDVPPQNYVHGQFEWSLDLLFQQNEVALIQKIQEAIQNQQAKLIFQQRMNSQSKKSKNTTFVCGKLFLSLMNAQNLSNSDKTECDTFVQISIQDTKHQSNAKFIDIANEQSFIQCKKNSDEMSNITIQSTLIQNSNNPSWVNKQNPQGEQFDLGMFMKKYPHFILIEVYHQKTVGNKQQNELVGFAELHTEDLISLENYGQEYYLFLEDSINKSSIIKLRTLFIPSHGTIERLNLDPEKSVFKNAQQFLFYKVLHMNDAYDIFGYKISLGKFMPETEREDKDTTQGANPNISIMDTNILQKRYEQFSPEHKRHIQLKEQNPFRPKFEENVYLFKQLWLYTQFLNRNQAMSERQRLFWEQYMNDLMSTPLEEGLIDDELKSIRSKLTNTTKMISSKYKKRTRQMKNQTPDGISTQDGSSVLRSEKKGSKFSVIFVGQWEKAQSWKYVDIWYLIKFGIPNDLRVSLWKDLLRRQINEQYEYVFFKKCAPYKDTYNGNISNYENMKIFANMRDSPFYLQIEEDVKQFVFPEGYQDQMGSQKEDRLEEERLSMYQIFKVYDLWAHEFSKRRHKLMSNFLVCVIISIVYNKGMLSIIQRVLSLMSEEDAFWTLVGMVKAFNNVYSFDFKGEKDQSQFQHYSPYLSRRVAFKNEMTILNCIIKLHYPSVFDKIKSLGMPIEWYFYTEMTQFFAYNFTSDLILRLWDMIVFNLSTNQIDNRKRALWYLLAVPLYMIHINYDLILNCQSPQEVKDLLIKRTPSLNYNPNLFIDELLSIIKEVFVKRNTVINKLFKTDKANQLESIRLDIEIEASNRYKEEIEESKSIGKYINEKQLNLEVNQKAQAYPLPDQFELVIKIMGFRNIFLPQLEEEVAQLQVLIQGDEKIESGMINLMVPSDIDIAKQQALKEIVTLKTRIQQNEVLQVKLIQIQNGIHQVSLGQGTINLNNYKTYIEESVSLKLFGNKETQNSYIDLILQLIPKSQQQRTASIGISGCSKMDSDLFYLEKDEEQRRLIKRDLISNQVQEFVQKNKSKGDTHQLLRQYCLDESLIRQIMNIAESSNPQEQKQQLQMIQNIMNAIPQVINELNLSQKFNQDHSKLLSKLMAMGSKQSTQKISQSLFKMFSNTQAITATDFARLIQQLYNVILYPIPLNEIIVMTNTEVRKGSYSNVVYVKQQRIVGADDSNIFSIFGKGTNEVKTFNVTDQFRSSLNQVVRMTGLIQEINMSNEPFNNIGFWIKNNNIKKQSQHLLISVQDNNGDQLLYRFRFNSAGLYEAQPLLDSILPIRIGGCPTLKENQFINAFQQMPLLEDSIRFGLFLDSQQVGSDDVYVDAQESFKITFIAVGRKFRFNFSSRIDKENDFTVDPSQLMRIAKGNIGYLYSKIKANANEEEIIEIKLSPLSRQDTFICIKQRMRTILDFIVQSENFSDVPNIMSEKFQFKKNVQSATPQYYNSMDRIMNVTSQKDTQFELVRVVINEDGQQTKYDSYALYHHADDSRQWRQCRILTKIVNRGHSDQFKIEFTHEPNNFYIFRREDLLLSLDYKRNQEGYYEEEVREFLDKLDREEVEIAQLLKEQDQRGMHGAGDFQDYEGLKIGNANLDDQKDEEVNEINAAMDDSFDY